MLNFIEKQFENAGMLQLKEVSMEQAKQKYSFVTKTRPEILILTVVCYRFSYINYNVSFRFFINMCHVFYISY